MFCPQCNAEYRPGFTRCADCDVELVNEPPHFALAGKPPAADPGDPNEDPFCSFWKGQDARVHAELCEVLEEAGIPHKTIFRSDHLFNFGNFPAYEIGVPFSLFEKAEKVVQETYGTDDVQDVGAQELAGQVLGPSGSVPILPEMVNLPPQDIPGPPVAGESADWFPEDATASVWSADSREQSEFLVAALHENGIHCRLDERGTQAKLYVLPRDATRAREIIREVVEGEPPK
ncbi:MAG TPA: hypothetical protein VNU20_07665 [Candidatus Sulfotelmatobacter sp.]|jgi:hypothetical protein|nr:hypothetical protein [Candidatus Sulfotelmatobacter sp.]